MTECEHGSDSAICPPCQGAARPTPAPTLGPVAFKAHYAGHCRGCNGPIDEGEWIRKLGDEYRHDDRYCLERA